MPAPRAYRAQRRTPRAEDTRDRILTAVRTLLEERAFHEATVEQVAERAGVSRATLYQHFRSRLELVDGICDTFAVNPALVEIRRVVNLPDGRRALDETIANSMRFWATEDAVLGELYGVAAIDPAAQDLIDRQRADRRGCLEQLTANLKRSGLLRSELSPRSALARLLVLTSYETFRELRLAGLVLRDLTRLLQDDARALLIA